MLACVCFLLVGFITLVSLGLLPWRLSPALAYALGVSFCCCVGSCFNSLALFSWLFCFQVGLLEFIVFVVA